MNPMQMFRMVNTNSIFINRNTYDGILLISALLTVSIKAVIRKKEVETRNPRLIKCLFLF